MGVQIHIQIHDGMAEVHGNRTHRTRLPPNSTGFEVQASHQARFTSKPLDLILAESFSAPTANRHIYYSNLSHLDHNVSFAA